MARSPRSPNIYELLTSLADILPHYVHPGFRSMVNSPEIVRVVNLTGDGVYGKGPTEESATDDVIHREGVPYPPCCSREYGMHEKTCKDY